MLQRKTIIDLKLSVTYGPTYRWFKEKKFTVDKNVNRAVANPFWQHGPTMQVAKLVF